MSGGQRIPLDDARRLAAGCLRELAPVSQRAVVAGAVRRERPLVGDIEIVLQPNDRSAGLFGDLIPDVEVIRKAAERLGTVLKGGDRMIQVRLHAGVNLDLYLVHPPAEWGTILAIRTGPANLGQFAVMRMQRYGHFCRQGRIVIARPSMDEDALTDDPEMPTWPTPTEADFFRAAGLPCLEPHLRDEPQAFIPIDRGEPVP